jgi:hypothetical protein
MPKIIARGLMALREQCVMPQLVNADYSKDAEMVGATIDVPVPTAQTVSDVTPSNTAPAPANITPTTVQISLNKWKKSDFHLTDKQIKEIEADKNFFPMQIGEALRALANQVNADIHAEYTGIYGFVGTPGVTPFASDTAAAVQARKVLNQQLCPLNNRRGVLNFDAEANALALAAFADADKAGENMVKLEGKIGRKYGLDWYADDQVVTHTAGVPGGTPLVNGAASAGATSVAIDGGGVTGTYKKGDIVTFAGHSQTYALTADVTLDGSGVGTLPISPALTANVADNAAVTLKASHVVNLAFHRDAFAFANRPIADTEFKGGNEFMQVTDPQTRITLALEISRQYKQTVWEFSLLYGVKLVRPELGVRIAG